MSVGESLGSHSLHSFAEFLQHHINSPEASSCLTKKPLLVLKPYSLNFMASQKSMRKGDRQRHGETSKDLPADLHELYKTDPEETYNERKTRIQWIQRSSQKSVPVIPTPISEEANDDDHETLDQVTIEPRRSTRVRSAPEWYGNPVLEVMLLDHDEPTNYEEAMIDNPQV